MNYISKSLWGVLLIIIGLILGLNALDITHINIFFDGWWTLFIIVPSVIGLIEPQGDKTGNTIGLIIGIAFFLACQGILRFELIAKLIVPFILVMIGISFLFGNRVREKVKEKIKTTNPNNLENIFAIFGEQKSRKDDEIFKGANLDAIFGGVTLDLRNASLEEETIIKASAIFGGIDILLPKDVNVKVNATPIFGSVDNKIRNQKDNKKIIYIDVFCMFGGIDIK